MFLNQIRLSRNRPLHSAFFLLVKSIRNEKIFSKIFSLILIKDEQEASKASKRSIEGQFKYFYGRFVFADDKLPLSGNNMILIQWFQSHEGNFKRNFPIRVVLISELYKPEESRRYFIKQILSRFETLSRQNIFKKFLFYYNNRRLFVCGCKIITISYRFWSDISFRFRN